MKDFFKLQITNKKLIPCLIIFLFIFLAIYFLSAHLQKEPEIVETPNIVIPTAEPKTPVIMTYQSRDPFQPIVKSLKPIAQRTEIIPSSPNNEDVFIDPVTSPTSTPTESTNQDTTNVNGIITSGGVSSALIHTPAGAQIVSMGDFVPGLGRVTKITADQVILQNEVDQTTLTLGGE